MKFNVALLLLSVAAYSLALIVQLEGLGEYWAQFMVAGAILYFWGWHEGRKQ